MNPWTQHLIYWTKTTLLTNWSIPLVIISLLILAPVWCTLQWRSLTTTTLWFCQRWHKSRTNVSWLNCCWCGEIWNLKFNNVTLRCIDTKQMIVDCLTKVRVKPYLLRYVLYTGEYAIMEKKRMLEAKAAAHSLQQHRQTPNTENGWSVGGFAC